MKTRVLKVVWLFALLTLPLTIANIHSQITEPIKEEATPAFFLGVGTGINDIGVLGMAFELPVGHRNSLGGSVGFGLWGFKSRVNLSYYPNVNAYKSCWTIGYAFALGEEDVELDLAVKPYGNQSPVTLDLFPLSTIDLIYSYNLKVGSRNKFVFSLGYSISTKNHAYRVQNNNLELSDSSILSMKRIQPGGILLGLKFLFASKSIS